jgi:predicted metal-dependent enzyme (double-stranded beta helix superfamily)
MTAVLRSPVPAAATPTGRLGQLLTEAVRDREHWLTQVRYDPERRWYRRVRVGDDHELWLQSWLPGQRAGLHDHGESAGAFAVLRGAVREQVVRPALLAEVPPDVALAGGGPGLLAALDHRPGSLRLFSSHHVHEVSHLGDGPAVTLHLYSPALTRTTLYEWNGSGLDVVGVEAASINL